MQKLPSMPEVVLRKLGRFILLFTGIILTGFLIIHLAPGSPADTLVPMSQDVSAEAREKMVRLYDLDRPIGLRFAFWAGQALRMDFGRSFVDGERVSEKIAAAIPVTVSLNLTALLAALALAVPIGTWCASRKGHLAERAAGVALISLVSFPSFWLALILISVFSVGLGWTPVSGLHSIFYEGSSLPAQWLDLLAHVALPLAVLTLPMTGALAKYIQASVQEELRAPYTRAARARGLSEARVLMNHAMRNAALPLVTLLGLSVPGLLSGSVVLESVFSLPGMGRLFFQSVAARDYPVIMGIFTIGALLTLAGNALADAAYTYADPRIRKERAGV